MFEKLIRFSIEQRWLVLLAALGMAALGVFSYQTIASLSTVWWFGTYTAIA